MAHQCLRFHFVIAFLRCQFDCLPANATVDYVNEMSTQTDLQLNDLLAVMKWLSVNDVIPKGVANITEYTESYVEAVDNLLDDRFVDAWNQSDAVPGFGTILLKSSQDLLENVARNAPSEFRHSRRLHNLEYEVLKTTNISSYWFESSLSSHDDSPRTSITIDKETFNNLQIQDNDDVALATLITTKGNFIHESKSKRSPVSHAIVHSLQVAGDLVSVPVTLQIKLLRERKDDEEPLCSFVDENESPSDVQWRTTGCYVDETEKKSLSVSCHCNHTTSFAILMQLKEFQISDADNSALEILTYVLCGLSIIGLMTTLSVFMALRSQLRSDRVVIHINLSVALISAHFLLLISGLASKNQIACRIVAIMMHYFFLAVFCWMLVEGAHLYIQIVRVFSGGMDKRKPYMVIGWGTPAVVVTISAALQWDSYVNYDSCWLSTSNNVIWAFVGPALAIIMVNMVILVMVVRIIVTSAAANKGNDYDHIKAGLKGALFLLPLLGLTWLFGVMSMNSTTLVFQYLFVILNGLQGVFIFLVYCAFNSEVRNAIQRSREKRALTRAYGISKCSTADNFGYSSNQKNGWSNRNRIGVFSTQSTSDQHSQPMATLNIQTETTTHTTTRVVLTRAADASHLPPENVTFAAWKL